MNTMETKMQLLPLEDVRIRDSFWSYYIKLVRDVVVPYQWQALNDQVPGAEPSRAIQNFKIAAGEAEGYFYGMVFQDSDVAKWLEAVGYLLSTQKDPELERMADAVIDLVAKAQHPDGYLNTYYTLKEPGNRWTDLAECHELYCAGHMIEAGVAYYKGTGKRKLLDVAIRLADHIDTVFGAEPGKLRGYDGHQEIELALMKLYETTGDEKYKRLAGFFLEERGRQPHFYDWEYERRGFTHHWRDPGMIKDKAYSQAHKPVKEQDRAIGHAVRFVYMCTGMAHVAGATGDREMLEACKRLWENMVYRQMYITGGIGAQAHGEAFSTDYDLPGDTAYAETCASIGLVFFAHRMLMNEPDSRYADVLDRALFNTVISGIARDGKSFFYVNPLEVYPKACGSNHNYNHVKTVRQGWFGCACCPPNIARLLASLGQYLYTFRDQTVYTHLYVGGEAGLTLKGSRIVIRQETDYPWDGRIRMSIDTDRDTEFTLALRIPDWCSRPELSVNGTMHPVDGNVMNGYVEIRRAWRAGDTVELNLPMEILRMKGHPLIRQTAGKVALQRGPLVYCLEEPDNGPGLHHLALPADASLSVAWVPNVLGGIPVIEGTGVRRKLENWGHSLYQPDAKVEAEPARLKFIPYFAWANRGEGEMQVWVNEERGSKPR